VPDAALALLDSPRLTVFLTLVGIGAVHHLCGRFLFDPRPVILAKSASGGGTAPVALAASQDAAGSQVPTLGYGVSYAVGSILLASCGSAIVALMGVSG
jgi:uncharacterized transporter YbjL